MGSPVMLTVTRTYKVSAGVTTQGEDYSGNDVTGPPRQPPYEPTRVS
jgi:hypothetical protein